jgi:hypothetical protein
MEVYRTISEMKRSNKQLNNMTQKELAILEKKIRRNRTILLVIIIILIIIFKMTIGYLRINVYTFHRGYEVSINKEFLSYKMSEEFQSPIIPFFIRFYNYWEANFALSPSNTVGNNDSYILSIKGYECYSSHYKKNVSCDPSKDILGEKSNYTIKYLSSENYKMYIRDSTNKTVYKGKFIKDITKYLKKNGYYYIEIVEKRYNVKTIISFEIKKGN